MGRPDVGRNSGLRRSRWLRHVPHRIDHPVSLLLVFIARLADFQFGLDHPRTQQALHRLVTQSLLLGQERIADGSSLVLGPFPLRKTDQMTTRGFSPDYS